ncbi:hypothetical protein [Rhodococcus sp. p52]|uniref:hypothetical protein n=1 Tax=Rhodococcus sp. p52 TaxID=935199 RepID=UPI001E53627D|nr:hypothetical protein [Rhodococcus sp. p52]
MTSAADRIRQQALRNKKKQTDTTPQADQTSETEVDKQPVPEPASSTPTPELNASPRQGRGTHSPRLRPVRKNVDLSPELNRKFGDWQRDTAVELGLARVTAQEVLTELLVELLDDARLSERIKERIYKSANK